MNELGITIGGQSFPHMLYHFVLTYSNWESVTLCFSESFESLSEGLQNALWELGGAPREHRTDRLATAVNNMSDEKEFTSRYNALLRHYRMEGQKIQAGKANENGDVEQRHHRFKRAVDQALMLRGSRDFALVNRLHAVSAPFAGAVERRAPGPPESRDAVSAGASRRTTGKHQAGEGAGRYR